MTLLATWTLSLATMVTTTLYTRSQTGMPSKLYSTSNQDCHDVTFSNKSQFCLQHWNGHIHVWQHHGEHTLPVCIWYSHTVPSPGVMICGATRNTSQLTFVHTDSIMNKGRCISVTLRLVTLPFLWDLLKAMFQHDNAQLLLWSIHSPDFLQVENARWMVAEWLAYHHMPVTIVDEWWHLIQVA